MWTFSSGPESGPSRGRAGGPAGEAAPAAGRPAENPPVGHRQWVSPVARRTAASLGVDLRTLTGTGPQGAITLHDVDMPPPPLITKPLLAPAPAPVASGEPKSAAEEGPRARRGHARVDRGAMSRPKREIPHYYLADEIILDTALAWLTEQNAGRPITERILPAVLQLKAVALAAQRYPEFNGFWRSDSAGTRFEAGTGTHVGVAISLRGGGLVAPAIHDVGEKPLAELMEDLTDLVGRARAGSLRSSEMSDSTITVTQPRRQGRRLGVRRDLPAAGGHRRLRQAAQRVVVVDGGIR